MSVDLCIELDQINWKEARKSLLVFDLKTGKTRPISTDALHLLFRIAWRQGEGYDGRAYLSENQWLRSTGLSRSSYYRDRSELEQTELIKRLVRGSNINGTRANLRVNLSKIRTLPKTNVPSKGQSLNEVVPDSGLDSALEGMSKSLVSDPKQHKQHKTTVAFKVNDLRFKELVINNLPHELRSKITNGSELDTELYRLLEAGYSDQQIKDKLNISYQWNGIHTPYPHVKRFISTLWSEVPVLAKHVEAEPVEPVGQPTEMPVAVREMMNNLFHKPE